MRGLIVAVALVALASCGVKRAPRPPEAEPTPATATSTRS